MMIKKGQVSTEYLVILAVVLVVALVVVALVSGMSPLSSGVSESQSRNYWAGVAPLAVTGWKYSNTMLELTLQNQEGQRITVTDISVDGLSVYSSNTTLAVGEIKTITANMSTVCSETFNLGNVEITYDKRTMSGLKETGAKAIVGRCS